MMSGREEMDRLMIGKCFTDQGLDTQIYASYAAQQLWGMCKWTLLPEFILHMVILNYYIVLYISFMTYIELLYCIILYATHQLWGRRKRKLCFCDRFSNTTDKMISNERNWIALLLYFIYLCTTNSYLQCVLEGDQNWMILWYWVCYSNCERNKPAMRRTAATNRVKPQGPS